MKVVGFFESEEGVRSMGRLLAFLAMCAGVGIIMAGIVYKDSAFVIPGAGLATAGLGLKGWQKTAERKTEA